MSPNNLGVWSIALRHLPGLRRQCLSRFTVTQSVV